MNQIRFVDTSVGVDFEECGLDTSSFEKEFNRIAEHDDDAIGQWLRTARARGDVGDSDPVMLHLMVELYRKMDRVENAILGNAPVRASLAQNDMIVKMGLEHFEISKPMLKVSQHYYGRFELPALPKRETPFFFEALSPTVAKISRMHLKDEDGWSVYMASRERAMIRHLKGLE